MGRSSSVLWVGFTGKSDEYYVQPMSFHRFRQVRDGEISLRNAFTRPEGAGLVVLQIDRQSDEARTERLNSNQIDESLLPLPGEALKLESPLPLAEMKMTSSLHFRLLRAQRQFDQSQRARHAADAGARLRKTR